MIVTCQECQTQFQLDDAKVPETGIRVRCSRCKSAFFVESPHRPDPDHAAQLAREALDAEPPRADQSESASTAPDEESDWQFNDDVDPVVGADDPPDDLAAARSAVDDLLGGAFADPVDPVTGEPDARESSDSGFDLAEDGFADESDDLDSQDSFVEPEPEPGPELEPELECESDDDPNAVTVDRGTWSGSAADSAADSGLDLADAAAADDIDESLAAPPETTHGDVDDLSDPFGEVSEDLGSPADWDFFEEGDEPSTAGFAAELDPLASSEPAAAFDADASQAVAAVDYAPDLDAEVSPGDAWFGRLRGALGWALVAGLCAYATTVVLFPGVLAPSADATAIRVAGFEAVRIEGRWIENAVAGPVYVVSGAFHSTGGSRPAPGSVLRVRLLDAHGSAVAAESAAVGPPIPIMRLRESNPRDLRTAQERSAPAIVHEPLARRKRRPFMAVLGDVPPEAVAFDFEVAAASVQHPVAAFDAAIALDTRAAAALAEEGMTLAVPAGEAAETAPAAER